MAKYKSKYTGPQLDATLDAVAGKQATLVDSGVNQNIKTINNQSILGTGNIAISQSDWDQTNTSAIDYIKNKPEIFSGNYNDLINKPTINNQTVKTSTVTFGSEDAVEIVGGTNVTITGDAEHKTITIDSSGGTYENKPAASGGTDVSLVTTGDKYIWNNKSNFSGSYNDLSNKPTIVDVEANPADSSSVSLTKLKVGSTVYSIDSTVVANPSDTASETLTKLKVGGTTYSVPQGGGGGGGTSDYTDLTNKPQIAGITLSGNKTLADLGIQGTISSYLKSAAVSGDTLTLTKQDDTTVTFTATSGTTDYTNLTNKPQVNSITLSGNKSWADLGLDAAVSALGYLKGSAVTDVVVDGHSVVSSGVASITMPDISDMASITWVEAQKYLVKIAEGDFTAGSAQLTSVNILKSKYSSLIFMGYHNDAPTYNTVCHIKISDLESNPNVRCDMTRGASGNVWGEAPVYFYIQDNSFITWNCGDKSYHATVILGIPKDVVSV